jgi:hypothetical protein
MDLLFGNFLVPWSCVRPPERRTKVSSLGARIMLAKLRELHQSLCPHPAKNPGAAWGNTCLTDLVSKGLMWYWWPLCCTGEVLRPCWGL